MSQLETLTIGQGTEVTMHFTLSLPDGTVADTTRESEPLTFTMGDGTLIEGLEYMLFGLKPGDKQCLSIDPRDAFGFPDEENVHELDRSEFNPDIEIKEGVIMEFSTPSGDTIPGTIELITEEKVRVDFNHPLAGLEIVFDVEILNIKASQEQLDAIANGDVNPIIADDDS